MTETPKTPAGEAKLDDLSARLVAVTTERDALRSERDTYRKLYLDTLTQVHMLEVGVVGRGRERDLGADAQTSMSLLALMMGVKEEPAAPASPPAPPSKVKEHERAKPTGRQVLPEKLPRIDIEVLPPEVQARGTDAFERIGEDVVETVERRPSSFVVLRVHKPKFIEKGRDPDRDVKVRQAASPEQPIERGLAGPALLADTIVRRWADHLPLHRLERIYGRDGLELARSTVCGWHLDLAQLVRPLVEAMWKDAFLAPYLCADATGVLVQDLEKCRNAHFFVVASPERHVLFGYSPKHNKAAVDALLAGYKGFLVADAHAVYDHLYLDGSIIESACNSHARRYFFKALSTDPVRARTAIADYRRLFQVERMIAKEPPEKRREIRQRESRPVFDALDEWCDREALLVVDESPISKALRYAQNHRAALRRYLDDGRLPISNNWSERELRREAVGRKNWIFLGSDDGGEANATFVSLIASCQLHGLEPAAYLRDLLCLLPGWKAPNVLELSPLKWRETSARDDVRAALAANVYRRASLGEIEPTPKPS